MTSVYVFLFKLAHRMTNLLPAATKLGQGNIFTSVCLSTGGEGCGMPTPLPGADTPPWEQTPPHSSPRPGPGTPWSRHLPGGDTPQTRHPPGADTPLEQPPPWSRPPRESDCSIRLTSGRYASYWNTFLFEMLSPN